MSQQQQQWNTSKSSHSLSSPTPTERKNERKNERKKETDKKEKKWEKRNINRGTLIKRKRLKKEKK